MADMYGMVQPVSEAREQLSKALARFRRDGARAAPVVFGSHRKPEAVLIPYALYAHLMEREERKQDARSALASVLAEVPGDISPELKVDVARAIDGEISADELYELTLERIKKRSLH